MDTSIGNYVNPRTAPNTHRLSSTGLVCAYSDYIHIILTSVTRYIPHPKMVPATTTGRLMHPSDTMFSDGTEVSRKCPSSSNANLSYRIPEMAEGVQATKALVLGHRPPLEP